MTHKTKIIFMNMTLNEYLTIVIPCKNEGDVVMKTLDLLNYQKQIENLNVIVCDCSTDSTRKKLNSREKDNFNLTIIEGGFPSVARNNGAKLVKTKYVLFLDADMFILEQTLLWRCVNKIMKSDGHLLTIKAQSTNGKYNSVFNTFFIQQKIMKNFEPFCLGGFMMMNTEKFWTYGGFNEKVLIAEDFQLSRKVTPKKFIIDEGRIFTSPRRFENKGLFYMIKLMFKLYINKNNESYFLDDKEYWS